MTNNHEFYRAFEDQMRGSRELIQKRLQIYTPFLEIIHELSETPTALDIGCGRGEWLEKLIHAGFKPLGVDTDQGMFTLCQQKDLPVEQGDGIKKLSAMPDESLVLVSAFHLVEHLAFDKVQTLIMESLRVLRPGGLLILETPNPDNLVVGSNTFYQDPTHERPIPAELLKFLPQYYGFAQVNVMRLQQGRNIETKAPTLSNVLMDVSPDYAVLAQKNGTPEQNNILKTLLEKESGIDLHTITKEYDAGIADRFNSLETSLQRLETSSQSLEQGFQNLEISSQNLEKQLQAIYNSRSWRITSPLRRIANLLRSLPPRGKNIQISRLFFSPIFWCLTNMVSFLRHRPKLYNLIYALCRQPGFNVLIRLYHSLRMHQASASWGNKPFLSPRNRKTEQQAWISNTRQLTTSELLQRIRNEILDNEEQEIPYDS